MFCYYYRYSILDFCLFFWGACGRLLGSEHSGLSLGKFRRFWETFGAGFRHDRFWRTVAQLSPQWWLDHPPRGLLDDCAVRPDKAVALRLFGDDTGKAYQVKCLLMTSELKIDAENLA